MNAKQTNTMVGRLVEHQSEFRGLSTENAQWVIQNPKEAIAEIIKAIDGWLRTSGHLLEPVGIVDCSMSAEDFLVREHFTGDDFHLGENFLSKVEKITMSHTTLRYCRLKQWSKGIPIINELGGEGIAETTFVELSVLIERQRNGESGVLLTNSGSNIFFIRDTNNELQLFNLYWTLGSAFGRRWSLHAHSLKDEKHSFGWSTGRIFSRNPSESKG